MNRKLIFIIVNMLFITYLNGVYHKIAHSDIKLAKGEMNITENILIIGDTLGLQLIDISNPVEPEYVGHYLTGGYVRTVKIIDDIAFLGNGENELLILDLSNPLEPQFIGSCSEINNLKDISIHGNLIFAATGTTGLKIIDIGDIHNPVLIGSHNSLYAVDVEFYNNYLFLANVMGAMIKYIQVIDVSDPTNPCEINLFYDFDSFKDMTIVDSKLIMLSNYEILIYDVSDPTDFNLLYSYDTNFNNSIKVENDIAYLNSSVNGLIVLDISNLEQIERIGMLNSPRVVADFVIHQNIVYLRDQYTGFEIYDISDPFNPYLAGETLFTHNLNSIVINENNAYCSEPESYIRIFNIDDPFSPYLTSSYNLYYNSIFFIVHNEYIYASVAGKFYILSISDPLYPAYICSISYQHPGSVLAYYNNHVLVGNSSGYLTMINVEDAMNPEVVSEIQIAGRIYDIEIYGHYAFLSNQQGLAIIDISELSNPNQVSVISINHSYMYSLERSSNTLYIANSYNGIQVVDISDPEHPIFMQTLTNKPDSRFLSKPMIKDDVLIIEDRSWNEFLFYDISTPETPQMITSFIWNIAMKDAKIYEDYVVVVNGFFGLSILDFFDILTEVDDQTLPEYQYIHLSNYPNPFNPSTTISFELTAKDAKDAKIEIYNLKGQKVKTFSNLQITKSSNHQIVWDGTDDNNQPVSSGVYFYKLKAGDFEKTKKCLLMK